MAVATVTARAAVCDSVPDVPVTVTFVLPAADDEDADRVALCATPTCRVRVEGAAVTPEGRPVKATDTLPLNPFAAVAVTETCWVPDPGVRLTLAGETARVKSAAGVVVVALLDEELPHPVSTETKHAATREPKAERNDRQPKQEQRTEKQCIDESLLNGELDAKTELYCLSHA